MSQLKNLVINGDFEAEEFCFGNWIDDNEILGWGQKPSVDHIHDHCSYTSENHEYWIPRQGRAALGFYSGGYSTLSNGDTLKNREYPSSRLAEEMLKGYSYAVSYWVKPSGFANKPWEFMTSDQASLAFVSDSSEMASHLPDGTWRDIFPFEPDVVNPHGMLYDYENYIEISSCYEAEGEESYFVIGDFTEFLSAPMDTLWKDGPSPTRFRPRTYLMLDDVSIYEVLDLDFQDTTLCSGDSLIIYKDNLAYGEVWMDGMLLEDSLAITESGEYEIYATTGDCEKSAVFSVDFVSCEDCNFYIPNVISPSASSPDDRMLVASDCSHKLTSATIYDRWGNVVYNSNSSLDWNGQAANAIIENGVYVYVIELNVHTSEGLTKERITGTVTVVR